MFILDRVAEDKLRISAGPLNDSGWIVLPSEVNNYTSYVYLEDKPFILITYSVGEAHIIHNISRYKWKVGDELSWKIEKNILYLWLNR